MPIHYSVGRGAKDAWPIPATANDFADFRKNVERLRKTIAVSPFDAPGVLQRKKERLPYLWGPMINPAHGRNAANAGDRDVMWLDMDGCSPADWSALRDAASVYRGFAYSTASHEHPTVNGEQRWRMCFALSRTVVTTEYKRLCEAVEQELMACYSLIGDGPVKWDRSVYNLDHMVYAPHESAIFIDFSGKVLGVDMLLARADDESSPPVSDLRDELSRLVALNNVTPQTFDDLRSAMWHPPVLADAQPQCGRHHAWASMGCRLAWFMDTEFEGQARNLWLEWSAAGGGSAADVAEAERRWDEGKLTADRTGFQAIFTRAQHAGWENPAAERIRVSSVSSVEDFDELPPEEPEQPRSFPHSGGYGKPGKFIVEGLVPVGVAMFYGPSSSFKSYCIISILCRVAMKTHRWAGRNIKGGAVLYVAAEGGSSVMPRVGAWADKYNGGKPVELFYTLPLAVDLSVPARVSAIIKEIRRIEQVTGEPVRIVAVDTLSQSMMQGDENSASDVAKFMAGATRIVNETGAAVIIVHHSGKDSSKGMRGSSAAFANGDAVIRVERIDDAVNLINEKQRTGPAQPTRGYLVPTVQLPEDVIAENEAYDDEYTSTEGDVYDPVRLTTERVFEDAPMAEIEPLMMERSESRKPSTSKWIGEQLDAAGGSIRREQLKTLWIDDGGKEDTFRRELNRMKKSGDIAESDGGILTDALGTGAQPEGSESV